MFPDLNGISPERKSLYTIDDKNIYDNDSGTNSPG